MPAPDGPTLPEEVVRAAGGVVWRPAAGGPEVLVVHRPKYDDWSLPKGKLHEGETDETGARREVEEGTGLRGTLGREMRPESGSFTPTQEVDEVRWMPVDEVVGFLSYDRDRTSSPPSGSEAASPFGYGARRVGPLEAVDGPLGSGSLPPAAPCTENPNRAV